jgi:thiamine-phosphate pyrophosphorylase
LQELTEHERKRIIVHDYPELYDEFSLKGIHLNGTVRCLPEGYTGSRTRSCHTFEEVLRYKDACDYVFLSPIFDSISKVGYKAGFSKKELQEASAQGIIDEKVVALGGVTFDSIPYLKHLGFGGVAMIGALYNAKALEYLTLSGLNSIRFPCP